MFINIRYIHASDDNSLNCGKGMSNRACCYVTCINYLGVEKELGFPGGSVIKNLPATAGDTGNTSSIPGLERSTGEGNSKPLQYSCQHNSMDRGAWQATVQGGHKELEMIERLNTSPFNYERYSCVGCYLHSAVPNCSVSRTLQWYQSAPTPARLVLSANPLREAIFNVSS